MRRKTAKMTKLEREHHQPIVQLLRDLYAETGSISGIADRLGVSLSTVSNWMARFDIPTRATLTPDEFLRRDQSGETPQ